MPGKSTLLVTMVCGSLVAPALASANKGDVHRYTGALQEHMPSWSSWQTTGYEQYRVVDLGRNKYDVTVVTQKNGEVGKPIKIITRFTGEVVGSSPSALSLKASNARTKIRTWNGEEGAKGRWKVTRPTGPNRDRNLIYSVGSAGTSDWSSIGYQIYFPSDGVSVKGYTQLTPIH